MKPNQAVANALSKQQNTVEGRAAFARRFVTSEMADTMPDAALPLALDLTIQLRALRSYYVEYGEMTSQAAVNIDHLPNWLAPGVWEGMNNANKRHLESCIKNEVAQINEGIQRAIAWVDRQLQTYSPSDTVLNGMMEDRMNQYPMPNNH